MATPHQRIPQVVPSGESPGTPDLGILDDAPQPVGDIELTISVRLNHSPEPAELSRLREISETLPAMVQEWLPLAEVGTAVTSTLPRQPPIRQPQSPVRQPQPDSIVSKLPSVEALKTRRPHLVVDLYAVSVDGRDLRLSPQELSLFRCLAKTPDEIVTRSHMIGCAWKEHSLSTDTRTVDVHIRRLRLKVQLPDLISTVRGKGYRLNTGSTDLTFVPRPTPR